MKIIEINGTFCPRRDGGSMFRSFFSDAWDDRGEVEVIHFALVFFMIIAVFFVFYSNHNLKIYTEEIQEKQGVLFDVWRDYEKSHTGLKIMVDGQTYTLYSDVYSNKTYGLKYSPDMKKLEEELEKKIGSAYCVNFKHADLAKNSRNVVHMSVSGEEFVNEEVAMKDFIADEVTARNVSIIFLILAVPTLVVVKKRLRYLKDSETA